MRVSATFDEGKHGDGALLGHGGDARSRGLGRRRLEGVPASDEGEGRACDGEDARQHEELDAGDPLRTLLAMIPGQDQGSEEANRQQPAVLKRLVPASMAASD